MKYERGKKLILLAWKYFQSQLSQEEKLFSYGSASSYLIGLKPFFAEKFANFNPREVKRFIRMDGTLLLSNFMRGKI